MKRLNQVPAANWDLALPNGDYSVRLVMGDASFQDQTNHIKIEGVTYTDTDPYDDDQDVDAFGDFDEVTRTVTITDGKLTLSPSSGCYNTKLVFIEVTPLSGGGGSATPGLAPATYKYDVLGRRVQKTVGSVTTTFVHAGDQVVAEYEGTSLKRRYIYGTYIDEPLAMVTSAGTQYYHQSRIYSVMALSNQSGQLAERYGYTPYGKRRVVSPGGATLAASAVGNQVGFTGRYHDGETQLTYFRARYQDAELGRFVGRDPLGYVNGSSLQASHFVPGGVDPTGTVAAKGHVERSGSWIFFEGVTFHCTLDWDCATGERRADGWATGLTEVDTFGYKRSYSYKDLSRTDSRPCTLKNGCKGTQAILVPHLVIFVFESYFGIGETMPALECKEEVVCECKK